MVGWQRTDPDPEPIAALRQVVEVSDAVRQFDRVVVREQVPERPKIDALGSEQRLRDQEIGSRARLPGRGKVLADPCFFETEAVEPLDLIEVPALSVANGSLRRMRRHQHGAGLHGYFVLW
jgi:hypothetical protein